MSFKLQIQLLLAFIFLGPLVLTVISVGIEYNRGENRDPIYPVVKSLDNTWRTTGTLNNLNVSDALHKSGMSWVQLIISQPDGTVMAVYPPPPEGSAQIVQLNQLIYD